MFYSRAEQIQEHHVTDSHINGQTSSCFSDTIVTSVVPGDYDGDSQMDVLVTTQIKPEAPTSVFIFWGNNQTLGTAPTVNGW